MNLSILVWAALQASGNPAPPAGPPAPQPEVKIEISSGVEEGKPVLLAKLTREGKPVEGAIVLFQADRLFGWLPLGRETTLDDGTAAIAFPGGLPGGPAGQLRIRAKIESPQELASLSGEATVGGARKVPHDREAFPRALWSVHAPLPLILTIVVLLGSVWITYATVLGQLVKIHKGAKT
jgi:hypothetical protein